MFERGITVDQVANIFVDGKVIEDYPADHPYPSALWLGKTPDRPLHAAAAENSAADARIIVTAYEPDATQWTSNWTTRKK